MSICEPSIVVRSIKPLIVVRSVEPLIVVRFMEPLVVVQFAEVLHELLSDHFESLKSAIFGWMCT